jgi:hypothetical protein
MQENLAITVGRAAIDRRDDVGILFGFVLPKDLALVDQVECKDRIGERPWTYLMLPITNGPPSCPRRTPVENVHATCNLAAFAAAIWQSLE